MPQDMNREVAPPRDNIFGSTTGNYDDLSSIPQQGKEVGEARLIDTKNIRDQGYRSSSRPSGNHDVRLDKSHGLNEHHG